MSILHVNEHKSSPIPTRLAICHQPDDLVVFLQNQIECSTCRTLQSLGAKQHLGRLHVVISGKNLTVTAADQLHEPSITISGRKVLQLPASMIFQLQREPPAHIDAQMHRSATGIAVFSWGKRRRRLMVTGVVDGFFCGGDRIIDAIESLRLD